MADENNGFNDFLKEFMERSIKEAQEAEREKEKAGYSKLRCMYLDMREAGFNMIESLIYVAAIVFMLGKSEDQGNNESNEELF